MLEPTVFRQFLMMQNRLLECLRQLHPVYFLGNWLFAAPARTELSADGEIWVVLKHGVGIMFVRRDPEPKLVIDVHAEIESADRIDAWRLQQFVESRGQVIDFEEAEKQLERGFKLGLLSKRLNGGYALIQDFSDSGYASC